MIAVTVFLYYSLSLSLASTLQPSLRVYIDLLSIYITKNEKFLSARFPPGPHDQHDSVHLAYSAYLAYI